MRNEEVKSRPAHSGAQPQRDDGARIENTTARDPALHLFSSLLEGADGYIHGMEAAGQRQLVNSDRLPTKLQSDTDEDFITLGFTFGAPDPNDSLFRPATLPPGWRREGSDHAMWSYLVDANGRRRVQIFYKAAFYDRDAFMSLRTIRSELSELLWGDDESAQPVVDDWTTREAWIDVIVREHDRLLVQALEKDDYFPKGARDDRKQARRCNKLLSELQ